MYFMFMMVAVHIAPSTCTFNVRLRFCTFALNQAKIHRRGIEPLLQAWKACVLTVRRTMLNVNWPIHSQLTVSIVSVSLNLIVADGLTYYWCFGLPKSLIAVLFSRNDYASQPTLVVIINFSANLKPLALTRLMNLVWCPTH